jgi:hypothetical protein
MTVVEYIKSFLPDIQVNPQSDQNNDQGEYTRGNIDPFTYVSHTWKR